MAPTSTSDPRPSADTSLAATREFFASRAAGWEKRFPDDEPAYRRAVQALAPNPGEVALDVGCGTGRALPALRDAVGSTGMVIGLDATPEMLAEAARQGRRQAGRLVVGDARQLPIPAGAIHAVFAAGLLPHLQDPAACLSELARITATGGRLVIFHPIGRAVLAARHGHELSPEDPLAPTQLVALLRNAGWQSVSLDDGADRYLAVAVRD
jgi:SAM-dependent methyltransferase